MTDVLLVVILVIAAGAALGVWLEWAFLRAHPAVERVFAWVERPLFWVTGIDPDRPMGWRAWVQAFLATHLVFLAFLFALFLGQGALPLNPDGVGGMSWDLGLHTAVSFLTNTNQQHYSGQAQLSYLSQLAGIVTAQFLTPAAGFAAMMAIVRGIGSLRGDRRDARGDRDLGNYGADLVRACTRLLVPLATALALFLGFQGVPATFAGAATATPLDPSAGMTAQVVPLGPVAPMVAIKQLGTNGGGWYGPNSSNPFENPTAWSNVAELAAILIVPVACAVLAGRALGGPFLRLTLGAMAVVAVALAAPIVLLELGPNPALAGLAADGPNWEGKELRFGVESSALWASATTMTSNGSVNAMHDSLLPLSGMVPLLGMFINAAFGGVGVGVINFVLYVVLAVFVAGLLVGRTPELFGKRLEAAEVRLVTVSTLAPSVAVLIPAAWFFTWGYAGVSNPGPHGVSQVLYEYASAAANNGSGFEGLGDNTPWWNLSCVVVLLIGRFVPIVLPIWAAGLLAARRSAPSGLATLSLGSVPMGVTLLGVMILLQLLTFVPALALGPVAEHLGGAAVAPVEAP